MGGHGPPDHCACAQLQDDSAIPPACPRREVGAIADIDRIGGVPRKLPGESVRGHRRGLARGQRRLKLAPRFAVEARLSKPSSAAAPADRQARLPQQRLHAARAIGATPLHQIALSCLVHLRSGCRGRAWRASTPRVGAAPPHCQDPTYTPDGTRCGRRLPPGVLHGSCGATDAAACFTLSRAAFQRAFSFRRRCSASYRGSSWTCFV